MKADKDMFIIMQLIQVEKSGREQVLVSHRKCELSIKILSSIAMLLKRD
jgi:hypothetical protein